MVKLVDTKDIKSKFDNFIWIGGDNPDRNILKILLKFKFILKYNKKKFILIQYFKDLLRYRLGIS